MLKRPIPTTWTGARRPAAHRPLAITTHTINSSNARRRTAAATAATPNAAADAATNAAAAENAAPETLLALKEWGLVIDAMLAGDQVLLLRKGGLLDGKFKLEAREFLLFPTVFHVDDPLLLAPGTVEKFASALALPEPKTLAGPVPLRCRARVEAAWSVTDARRVVEALARPPGLHVWGGAFAAARLKWRPGAPMTLALVRAYARRGDALAVRQRDEYYGCFSWARVEPVVQENEEDEGEGWEPVLSDAVFSERAALAREGLAAAGIEATPLEL